VKTCTACKKELPLSEFYKDKSRKGGLTLRCKTCTRKRRKKISRRADLKKRYNLSTEEYEYISFKQGHKCAICGTKSTNGRRLSVDHDHSTGAIRGLLCQACNSGIGQLKDDPDVVIKAYNYLVIHNHNQQQQKENQT
jgi:hypothetical protein